MRDELETLAALKEMVDLGREADRTKDARDVQRFVTAVDENPAVKKALILEGSIALTKAMADLQRFYENLSFPPDLAEAYRNLDDAAFAFVRLTVSDEGREKMDAIRAQRQEH
jgi:hypothetical protein